MKSHAVDMTKKINWSKKIISLKIDIHICISMKGLAHEYPNFKVG